MNIKNLVFKGGGVLGLAYAGAICELEKRNILTSLERVAGTSAGAITACLIALKYTSREIDTIVSSTDFKSFEDGDGNLFQKMEGVLMLPMNYGIHPGKKFLKWMQDQIVKKGLSASATFADFKKAGYLDLNVFAANLNKESLQEFSFAQTPNYPVAEAIRCSMSIPVFFDAYQFENLEDKNIYVDGGVDYNFPLTVFDTTGDNPETMGLFIGSLKTSTQDNGLFFGHPFEYIKAVIQTILNSQNESLKMDQADIKRTIVIDNCGISATNFGLTVNDKINLFVAGQKAVNDYFA